MPGQFSSATQSNLLAIVDAVHSIALSVPTVGWAGSTRWRWPRMADVAGYPWLAVPWPTFAGYYAGGRAVGNEMVRGPGIVEMAWDIEVHALAPMATLTDERTYTIPAQALLALHQVFTTNYSLNRTCTKANVSDPHVAEIAERDQPANRFFSGMLTIRAYEQLPFDNTPV